MFIMFWTIRLRGNFIFNMEAPYLTDMELKSEYEAVVR